MLSVLTIVHQFVCYASTPLSVCWFSMEKCVQTSLNCALSDFVIRFSSLKVDVNERYASSLLEALSSAADECSFFAT